jgi:hypothetical protein
VSDPRPPADGSWPERDLDSEADDARERTGYDESGDEPDRDEREPLDQGPPTETAAPTTAFTGAGEAWNPRRQGERRRPTTAEQAVPWLIGISLALAGVVIVLLALIFTSPDGLMGGVPTPTPSPSPSLAASLPASVAPSVDASVPATPTPAETAQPTPAPTPTPAPEYGALEMVYLGRPSAVAPIYLLRRDFSTADEPDIMAQASEGVTRFAWSPDGRVGAAIIAGRAVALTPGQPARALADNVTAVTFGWDEQTVYGVRIVRDGVNDRAEILELDFVSGASSTLASITYPHPAIGPDPPLREAQFIDDGGTVRIYAGADGNLAVWILGAPAIYQVDPGDGGVAEITREPILWSPDGRTRITLSESASGSTVIGLRNRTGEAESAVTVSGLVSHIRWARTANEIVFTLGQSTNAGGVRQNLYVWDLVDGKAPQALTSNGASFGAEWLGVMPNWLP